jgi:hypothetical protein
MERLLLIHDIITRLIGGLYLAPIDKAKTRRILDIGTGTGVCKWHICMSQSETQSLAAYSPKKGPSPSPMTFPKPP